MRIVIFLLITLLYVYGFDLKISDPVKVNVRSNQFPEIDLEANTLGEWINDEILLPSSLVIKGDYLLVLENDFRVNEQLIKFFSLSEERMVGYYGRSGSGPGEIQGGLRKIPVYGSEQDLSFLDFSRKRVSVVEIEKVLNGEHYKEPDTYKVLPPDYMQMQFGTILNDTLIVGGSSIREGKLLFGNYKTNNFRLTDFIPEIDRTFDPFLKPNVYLSQIAVNKNKERVVVSNLFFNQIEIYNFHGDLELIIADDYSAQEFESGSGRWHSRSTIEYYRGVITTDDHIMAIYYNLRDHELRDQHGEIREGVKSSIRVFDWEGRPVAKLNLDRRVTQISYDEENGRIIALDRDVLDSIVEFNIDL